MTHTAAHSDARPSAGRFRCGGRERDFLAVIRGFFSLKPVAFLVLSTSLLVADEKPNPASFDFFEASIRPVLVDQCYSCHSVEAEKKKKLRGGLYLDSRSGVHKGGDSGPAVVPGKPQESLIVKALRGKGDLSMPPKHLLPASVVADFERWIEMGVPDPRDETGTKTAARIDIEAGRSHWAFQPFSKPMTPAVRNSTWVRTPIDAFVLAKMEKAGMDPAPEADRRVWLRRVYLDLIGLPPTPKEQSAFLSDNSAQSFEHVVDDLLSRPQYGERWARHWLDIARYGESIGYEADTQIPFAWRYRDYVIQAFNNDIPFDQFAIEQLAGDELPDFDSRTQIATTFLRLGTNESSLLGKQNTLDDTLGMAVGAFLGLNIQCARCHDHKFEPLSQADYYGLMAVFGGIETSGSPITVGNERERAEVAKALEAWKEEYKTVHSRYDSLRAGILSRAEAMRAKVKLDLNAKEVAECVAALQTPIDKRTQGQLNQFDEQFEGVTQRLKKLADAVGALATEEEKAELAKLAPGCEKFRARKPELTRANAVAGGGGSGPYRASTSKSGLPQVHVLIRGEPTNFGPPAEMRVPKLLGDGPKDLPRTTKAKTPGRRLWFAQWMTREARPLLARVLVNRVWQYHFGRGFMPNANAFGLTGGTPSHPELLEWLASNFEESGLKLKPLHRQIVLSSAYRLAAKHPRGEADPGNELLARWEPRRLESEAIRDSLLAVSGRLNLEMGGPSFLPPIDPEELHFSHNPAAKIGWEKAGDSEASRRSVYVFVKRSLPLPEFRLLGMADPNVVTPKREVMTTAIQALALFNGRFAHEQAGFLAKRIVSEAGARPEDQVRALFGLVLGRPPSTEEQELLLRYLAEHPRATQRDASDTPVALQSLCLIVLNTNEFVYIN